jgi:hypothetical protein
MGGMTANAKAFTWTDQRLEAARLLGEGDLEGVQIAERVGVHLATLYRWRDVPAFMERVKSAAVEAEDAVVSRGLGRKGRRVGLMSHHVGLLDRIVTERGKHYAQAYPDVPGAGTGLLTLEETVVKQTTKSFRGVRIQEEVTQRKWSVDAALIREHRALLMQISKEVGGIVDRTMNLNVNVDADSGSEPPPDLESLRREVLGRLAPGDERKAAITVTALPVPE